MFTTYLSLFGVSKKIQDKDVNSKLPICFSLATDWTKIKKEKEKERNIRHYLSKWYDDNVKCDWILAKLSMYPAMEITSNVVQMEMNYNKASAWLVRDPSIQRNLSSQNFWAWKTECAMKYNYLKN